MRAQLAGTLKGIVSQCLIPCGGGTARVAATELLVGTDAILNLVCEGKAHQIPAMMQTGSSSDMHTLAKGEAEAVYVLTLGAANTLTLNGEAIDF